MKRITITEASKMLNVSEQCTRMMIQAGQIPGASYHGETRKTYYITDEQVKNVMKGART
jgi:excisionase family DNA binding protein